MSAVISLPVGGGIPGIALVHRALILYVRANTFPSGLILGFDELLGEVFD